MPAGADTTERTTCVIAGGGPAGIMLGLVLARGGVDVTVMEKHADFLRDFRGDTVHASTLRLLDELGLANDFARMPHREIYTLNMKIQRAEVSIDLSRIPAPHKNIALVPQWDFLELLAAAAEKEPTFRLLRSTEVLAPIRRGNKVIGVSYRDNEGQLRELPAELTVACDGRSSTLRNAMGLTPRSFGAPMDVWWFRLPRSADGPHGLAGVLGAGHALIVIDRGDYCQCAYVIPNGRDTELRAQGIETLHRGVVDLVPWLAGHITSLTSFDDVKLLDVQLNRLRRRYAVGLLLIGALIQSVQRVIYTRVIAVAVSAGQPAKPPLVVRIADKVTALRTAAGYAIAIGPLPEHVPEFARRLANRRRTRANTSRRRAARQSMMSA